MTDDSKTTDWRTQMERDAFRDQLRKDKYMQDRKLQMFLMELIETQSRELVRYNKILAQKKNVMFFENHKKRMEYTMGWVTERRKANEKALVALSEKIDAYEKEMDI